MRVSKEQKAQMLWDDLRDPVTKGDEMDHEGGEDDDDLQQQQMATTIKANNNKDYQPLLIGTYIIPSLSPPRLLPSPLSMD